MSGNFIGCEREACLNVEASFSEPDVLSLIAAPQCQELSGPDKDLWQDIAGLDVAYDTSSFFTANRCNGTTEGHFVVTAVKGVLFIKGDYSQFVAARGVNASIGGSGRRPLYSEIHHLIIEDIVYCALTAAHDRMEAAQLESALLMINDTFLPPIADKTVDIDLSTMAGDLRIQTKWSDFFNSVAFDIRTSDGGFFINKAGNVFKQKEIRKIGVSPLMREGGYSEIYLEKPTDSEMDRLNACLNSALLCELGEDDRLAIIKIKSLVNDPGAIPEWIGWRL